MLQRHERKSLLRVRPLHQTHASRMSIVHKAERNVCLAENKTKQTNETYVSIWDIDRQVIFGNLKKAVSLETVVFFMGGCEVRGLGW